MRVSAYLLLSIFLCSYAHDLRTSRPWRGLCYLYQLFSERNALEGLNYPSSCPSSYLPIWDQSNMRLSWCIFSVPFRGRYCPYTNAYLFKFLFLFLFPAFYFEFFVVLYSQYRVLAFQSSWISIDMLIPGRKYPETGIRFSYDKPPRISWALIQNSILLFLRMILLVWDARCA